MKTKIASQVKFRAEFTRFINVCRKAAKKDTPKIRDELLSSCDCPDSPEQALVNSLSGTVIEYLDGKFESFR